MTDILILKERVRNTISLGESHFREFKSAFAGPPDKKKAGSPKELCKYIGEALVAFANADGGELLIGVEDDGTITGIPHDEHAVTQMLNAPKTHVHHQSKLPIHIASKLEIDNKIILFFSISKGTTEIYQLPDGRCVRRKDKSTEPAVFNQIRFERGEVISREYDRQFVDGAKVNDLDIDTVQSMADIYLKGLSVEGYMQQLGLAEYAPGGLQLRRAALLLFAKDINQWHPGCIVRILKISGTQLKSGPDYNVISDERVQGNIFKLLLTSWEELRPYLAYKTEFGADAKFEQKYIYPEGACREALVNAIAHRDYSRQNSIEIFIFDDRMEIKSPGPLLSTLTVKGLNQLEGAHESRNVLIATVLRENKYMRELGEGMKRIFQLMEQSELDKPKLFSNSTWFSVTLLHKSVYNEQQLKWLKLFESSELTKYQKKIVALGIHRDISPDDIYTAMNTNDRNTYDREVTGLRKAGILYEIRTNVEAKNFAKNRKIKKQKVPRFKILHPNTNTAQQSVSRGESRDSCVHIAGLPPTATAQTIKNAFERSGEVNRVDLPRNPKTRRLKGFGFVWFYSSVSAAKAIKELNGIEIDGCPIVVKKYTPNK